MMRKICFMAVTAIVWFTATRGYGQPGQPAPKRTTAEQAAFEKSVPVNLAKITSVSPADPKMDPAAPQVGPVKWKAAPAPADERKISPQALPAPVKPVLPATPAVNNNQPRGGDPGGSARINNTANAITQPAGEKPGNDSRNPMVPGPATQPAGEKPRQK